MSGFQPIVIDSGILRRVGADRTETKFLNVGPGSLVSVIGETITITQSFHYTVSPSMVNLRTILGGEEGDLLFYGARNVRLRTGGNILKNLNPLNDEAVALILTPIGWAPLVA